MNQCWVSHGLLHPPKDYNIENRSKSYPLTENTKEANESETLEIGENSNLIEKNSTEAAKGGCKGTEENKSSITEEGLDINQADYDNT